MTTKIELLSIKEYRVFVDSSDKTTGSLIFERAGKEIVFDFYKGYFISDLDEIEVEHQTEIRGMCMLFAKEFTQAKVLIQHNLTPRPVGKFR